MTDPTLNIGRLAVHKSPTSIDAVRLPLDLATEAQAILGQRGRGKTNTAVVIAEEMIEAGVPVVVVDTVGVWWGLRSSADGKAPGLPVVVFGGEHGHVPLTETAGPTIARLILAQRFPAVIDTSGFTKAAARRFLLGFVTTLYEGAAKERKPLHVIFDEADELAPQRTSQEGARLLGAMEDFVRRGRSRGLGVTLVTQRPAVLNKDVLTQVEVLWALGMTGPTDVKAIDAWTQLNGTDEGAKTMKDTLASLPRGTAWLWSPHFLEVFEQVAVRRRRTFDSSATPKIGDSRVEPTAFAEIDVAALGAEIAATVEAQRADDPKVLRARIVELERELRDRPAAVPVRVEVERRVPVMSQEALGFLLDDARMALDRLAEAYEEAHTDVVWNPNAEAGALHDGDHISRERIVTPVSVPSDVPLTRRGGSPLTHGKEARTNQPAPKVAPSGPPASVQRPLRANVNPATTDLSPMQRSILTVLAQRGPSSRRRIGAFSGRAHGGGAFTTAMGLLAANGYITQTAGVAEITDDGAAALGPYEPLPTGQALIDSLLGKMSSMERAIFETLIDAWPAGLSRAEIGERSGKSAGGGAFTTAMGKLTRVELVRRDGSLNYVSDEVGEALYTP